MLQVLVLQSTKGLLNDTNTNKQQIKAHVQKPDRRFQNQISKSIWVAKHLLQDRDQ